MDLYVWYFTFTSNHRNKANIDMLVSSNLFVLKDGSYKIFEQPSFLELKGNMSWFSNSSDEAGYIFFSSVKLWNIVPSNCQRIKEVQKLELLSFLLCVDIRSQKKLRVFWTISTYSPWLNHFTILGGGKLELKMSSFNLLDFKWNLFVSFDFYTFSATQNKFQLGFKRP